MSSSPSQQASDIGQSLPPLQPKKIFAIGGGKGGVGKTALTAAMGIALAEAGKSTVVVDADFGGANLHQALGILNPPVTIKNFIDGQDTDLNNLVLETSVPNLYLLAGSPGSIDLVNMRYSEKQKVLRHMRDIKADFIFLDLGAGGTYNQLDYFLAADEMVLVVTPDPLSIQDSYSFLKLSLFLRLYWTFRKNPFMVNELKEILKQSLGLYSQNIKEITSHIARFGDDVLSLWIQTIQSFRPRIIVNMLESEEDLRECLAIKIAAKEILNITIKSISYIRYDDDFRRAVKMMRPDLLMSEQAMAAFDIRRIIQDLFFAGGSYSAFCNNASPTRLFRREKPPLAKEDDIICSVKCRLWGACSLQQGGYPCRVKVIGYINQLQSTES